MATRTDDSMGMPKMPAAFDFTKMFAEMKMPMMPDMEAFLSAHRRNMETLSAANRVALEGAQAVARRHMEIMQQTMAEMAETMQALASPEPPQTKTTKQAELMKRAYEHAVSNLKEISELIQKSNGEALGILNTRFTEAVEEIKTLTEKAQKQA